MASELSARERDVLLGISEGLTNANIGRKLFITSATVSMHIQRIFKKLGARDRANAVALGFQTGLLKSDLSELQASLVESARENLRLKQLVSACFCPRPSVLGVRDLLAVVL